MTYLAYANLEPKLNKVLNVKDCIKIVTNLAYK